MADLDTRMLIGGEAVAGNGSPLEVENHDTEETVASVGSADPELLDVRLRGGPRGIPRVGPDAGGGSR